MKGVRIYQAGFADIVQPVLPKLADFTCYSGSFGAPFDASCQTERDHESSEDAWLATLRAYCLGETLDLAEGSLFRPGALPFLAPGVSNDWNEVLFFDTPTPNLEQRLRTARQRQPASEYLEGHLAARLAIEHLAPCVFLNNWDGAYWQLFSRRKEILNPVVANAQVRGWKWQMVDFALEYPDPSDVALDYALKDYLEKRAPRDGMPGFGQSSSNRPVSDTRLDGHARDVARVRDP